MKRTVMLVVVAVATVSLAQDQTPPAAQQAAPAGPFSKGRVAVRGGINLDLNQSINLGGVNSTGARVTVGAHGGVGYFIIDNLSLDVDGNFLAYLTPTPGVATLEIIPGARYQVIPQLQLRVGVPIPLLPQFGLGVLGGLSYFQPIGSNIHLVVGVNYTYYLTEGWRQTAPLGRIDLHGGVQTSF